MQFAIHIKSDKKITLLDFSVQITGFESDGNAAPILFYTTGTSFPLFFFQNTPIVNCNFPWKSFGYKADSLASAFMHVNNNDSDICVYVYGIMDDTSTM